MCRELPRPYNIPPKYAPSFCFETEGEINRFREDALNELKKIENKTEGLEVWEVWKERSGTWFDWVDGWAFEYEKDGKRVSGYIVLPRGRICGFTMDVRFDYEWYRPAVDLWNDTDLSAMEEEVVNTFLPFIQKMGQKWGV